MRLSNSRRIGEVTFTIRSGMIKTEVHLQVVMQMRLPSNRVQKVLHAIFGGMINIKRVTVEEQSERHEQQNVKVQVIEVHNLLVGVGLELKLDEHLVQDDYLLLNVPRLGVILILIKVSDVKLLVYHTQVSNENCSDLTVEEELGIFKTDR